MARFVLFDRDGVINQCIAGGYVTSGEKSVFQLSSLEGLRLLSTRNHKVIVVSSQAMRSCV